MMTLSAAADSQSAVAQVKIPTANITFTSLMNTVTPGHSPQRRATNNSFLVAFGDNNLKQRLQTSLVHELPIAKIFDVVDHPAARLADHIDSILPDHHFLISIVRGKL